MKRVLIAAARIGTAILARVKPDLAAVAKAGDKALDVIEEEKPKDATDARRDR